MICSKHDDRDRIVEPLDTTGAVFGGTMITVFLVVIMIIALVFMYHYHKTGKWG